MLFPDPDSNLFVFSSVPDPFTELVPPPARERTLVFVLSGLVVVPAPYFSIDFLRTGSG